jgi:tRNA(Ile2) C34 agmatinyltransferase TiaS
MEVLQRKQRLVEIVKRKSQNLKEVVVRETPRCSQCQAKLKFIKVQDQAYLSCQKIKILTVMKRGDSKEEIYQKG